MDSSSSDEDMLAATETVAEMVAATALSEALDDAKTFSDSTFEPVVADFDALDISLSTTGSVPATESTTVNTTQDDIRSETVGQTESESLPTLDKNQEKERQLQEARQVWAILDAMGPGKAPKKCERPFTGRQQELYQETVALTVDCHVAELNRARLKEKFDHQLSILESLYIDRGLEKLERSKNGVSVRGSPDLKPNLDELTLLEMWYFELNAYVATRETAMKSRGDSQFNDYFKWDNLCIKVEYRPLLIETSQDALVFSTRRRKKEYEITIKYDGANAKITDVTCEDMEPLNFLPNDEIRPIVEHAFDDYYSVKKLIRQGVWKWLDEMEKPTQKTETGSNEASA